MDELDGELKRGPHIYLQHGQGVGSIGIRRTHGDNRVWDRRKAPVCQGFSKDEAGGSGKSPGAWDGDGRL